MGEGGSRRRGDEAGVCACLCACLCLLLFLLGAACACGRAWSTRRPTVKQNNSSSSMSWHTSPALQTTLLSRSRSLLIPRHHGLCSTGRGLPLPGARSLVRLLLPTIARAAAHALGRLNSRSFGGALDRPPWSGMACHGLPCQASAELMPRAGGAASSWSHVVLVAQGLIAGAPATRRR